MRTFKLLLPLVLNLTLTIIYRIYSYEVLQWDVNIRYIILGMIASVVVDGVWAIHYYECYLNYFPYWIGYYLDDLRIALFG